MFTSRFKAIAALIAAGCALLIGAWVVAGLAYAELPAEKPATSHVVTEVSCPTEDSCAIDYQGGTWTVRQVTP